MAIVEPIAIVADYGVFNHSYNQLRPRVERDIQTFHSLQSLADSSKFVFPHLT